ncbi:MAG: hypothetical protein FJX54_03610 [Alphaproteobacteria bacterium]|nr:hypothetical protein [Alphaproteobacteria bacterium]
MEAPVNVLAVAVADAAWSMFAAGYLWNAVELGERGLHALDVVPSWSAERIDAELVIGRISAVANFQGDGGFGDGGFNRTIAIGEDAADEARKLGDVEREAAAYDVAGLAHYYADMMWLTETYDEASGFFERARRLLEPDGRGLASVLLHQGLVEERLGRFEVAEPLFLRSAALAEAAGEELTLSYAVRHLAFGHQRRRDFDKALVDAERSLDIRRRLGLRPYLPLTLLAVADIRRAKGERDRADTLCAEALDEARAMRLPCGEVFALLSLASAARDRGSRERARDLIEEAAGVARQIGYLRWIKAVEGLRGALA